MKNQGFRYGERGGAIVWILILIALLGVLTFAATRGNRGGMTNLDNERLELAASEVLSFAQGVREGVRSLKIKGCQDIQISFETNALGPAYHNPGAPTDESCHVFKSAGAGLPFTPPTANWFDINNTGTTHSGQWFMTGDTHVLGVGTNGNMGPGCIDGTGACKELIAGLAFISRNLCEAINRKLRFGKDSQGTPPIDLGAGFSASDNAPFTGTYSITGYEIGSGATGPDTFNGKLTGCYEATIPADTYHFYQVLLAR